MNDASATNVATTYTCECCDYSSSRKSDYKKHLTTHKHKLVTNSYNFETNNDAQQTIVAQKCYECECGKSYKHRQNLHAHKKKCVYKEKEQDKEKDKEKDKSESLIELDNINYKDLFMKMIHENQELRKTIVMENQDLRNQITELIPKVGNNNTINNKQRFNINIFLNEQCKDALTMNEFIDKIKVTLENLVVTKNKGLTEGVSNIFIENMNKLSVHERPMHCTDVKRETVYIKCGDDDKSKKWEKDEENIKLKSALKKVSHVQRKNLVKWTEEHPNWMNNSEQQEEYIMLVKNCTEDLEENKRENKVIKKLCSEVYIGDNE
jgi:hypothetical protein